MEILEKENEFNHEKDKFKLDIESWKRIGGKLSDELNERMKEVISDKNNLNLKENLSSFNRKD